MRSSVNVSTRQSVVPPDRLARLNAAIDDIAKQPSWSYKRVANEAGIDVMTLNALRWGKTRDPDERTLRGIDKVLGFEPGQGLRRILDGKLPIRVKREDEESATVREIRDKIQRIESMQNLKPEQQRMFIGVLLRQIDAIVEQADEANREQRDTA